MYDAQVLTLPASTAGVNEDAVVTGDGVAVVVDGAGLPAELRAGCRHSVAWFATSVARTLHPLLVARSSSMTDALAEAISRVRDSHEDECELDRGSPSATVAAWRVNGDHLGHLVLCDASIVVTDRDGRVTHTTDDRLERVVATAGTRAQRRAAVESARNQTGGFWCVHTDPSAAAQARHGSIAIRDLAGAVACSDGGSRAFDLLGTHTLEEFAALAGLGDLSVIAESIRGAEEQQAQMLRQRGIKVHDDLTLVAQRFADR